MMKKIFILLAFVMFSFAGYSQATKAEPAESVKKEAPKANLGVFEWVETTHDFGQIKHGTPATNEFKFVNKGNVPLVIMNVQASCGCTTPGWSKEPIPPGGEGYVKATFNAATMGAFSKSVTITANVENGYAQLIIKGEVSDEPKPTVQ